jgi:hypothetical protein
MKKTLVALMMVCLVGAFCITASAQDTMTPAAKAPAAKAPAAPSLKMTGDITSIDTAIGQIKVKDSTGAEKAFTASKPKIKTLKVGEKVTVTYTEGKKGVKVVSIKPVVEPKVTAAKKPAEKGEKKEGKAK